MYTTVSGLDFNNKENVTHRQSELQDITHVISSKKCCINTCQIIKCKTVMSILIWLQPKM
jgi:hypothetical protein